MGEIELGYERTVHPGMPDVVAKLLAFTAWHKPNNDDNRDDDQDGSGQYIAPKVAFAVINCVHKF